jgi:hypothetical protein
VSLRSADLRSGRFTRFGEKKGPMRLPHATVRRVLVWGLVALAGVAFLLAGPYALLVCVNAFNPMQLVFLTSFTMYNESGADLWVTPVGMWEGSGSYGPLPRYRDAYPPAWRLRERSDLLLPADGELQITYDWDDINIRHVLVRTSAGDVYIMDTDQKGDLHGCYAAQQERYGIPQLSELELAPEELLRCTRGENVSYEVVEY